MKKLSNHMFNFLTMILRNITTHFNIEKPDMIHVDE